MTAPGRREHGDYPTPPHIGAVLAREALRAHIGAVGAPRVLDPACGEGALLRAAAAEWARRAPGAPAPRLLGVEIDPARARAARRTLRADGLRGVRVVTGDALLRPAPLRDAAFDVVIANPPFLSPTARRGSMPAAQRRVMAARLGAAAVRPLTNIAALFLADAVRLVRPGGTVAMILPSATLGTRDAAGVREQVRAACALEWAWLDGRGAFEVAVDVCAVLLRKGRPQPRRVRMSRGPEVRRAPSCELTGSGDAGSAWRFDPAAGGHATLSVRRAGTIGDVAHPIAGFRRHFYAVAAALREAADGPGRPVVTTGLIDPGRNLWGDVPARIAGTTWRAPVAEPSMVDRQGLAPGWMQRTTGTKVLVATQTRVLEAAVDVVGDAIPGVPVIALPADEDTAWLLGAALTSPFLTRLAYERHRGAALSPDAIKLSGAQLAALPLPGAQGWWDRGAEHLRAAAAATDAHEWRAALRQVASAMDRAYGVRAPASDRAWWLGRLPPFRSPAPGG